MVQRRSEECVRVVVRCRPMSEKEVQQGIVILYLSAPYLGPPNFGGEVQFTFITVVKFLNHVKGHKKVVHIDSKACSVTINNPKLHKGIFQRLLEVNYFLSLLFTTYNYDLRNRFPKSSKRRRKGNSSVHIRFNIQ